MLKPAVINFSPSLQIYNNMLVSNLYIAGAAAPFSPEHDKEAVLDGLFLRLLARVSLFPTFSLYKIPLSLLPWSYQHVRSKGIFWCPR